MPKKQIWLQNQIRNLMGFFTMNYKGIYKILYFDKHVQEYTINMLTHSHKYKYNIHSSMSLLETHLEVREARPKVGS